MKTCNKCGETKPASEFYRRKSYADGLEGQCAACHRQATQAWKRANPDKVREQRRRESQTGAGRERRRRGYQRRKADPEYQERKRRWVEENQDLCREYSRRSSARNYERRRKWFLENREYVQRQQRRARERYQSMVWAVNAGQPWTKGELDLALDKRLTLVEAAIALGRSPQAVGNVRHKHRDGK